MNNFVLFSILSLIYRLSLAQYIKYNNHKRHNVYLYIISLFRMIVCVDVVRCGLWHRESKCCCMGVPSCMARRWAGQRDFIFEWILFALLMTVLCTSQNLSGPMGKANTHHIQTHAIPAQIYSFLPNRTIGFVVAFDFVHRVRDVDVQGHSWILARATIGRVRIEILYMRMHSRSLDGQMARTKKKYKNHKWIAMH